MVFAFLGSLDIYILILKYGNQELILFCTMQVNSEVLSNAYFEDFASGMRDKFLVYFISVVDGEYPKSIAMRKLQEETRVISSEITSNSYA